MQGIQQKRCQWVAQSGQASPSNGIIACDNMTPSGSSLWIVTQLMVLAVGLDDHQIADNLQTMDVNPAVRCDDITFITLGKSDIIDDD